jgi:hypothetical protein
LEVWVQITYNVLRNSRENKRPGEKLHQLQYLTKSHMNRPGIRTWTVSFQGKKFGDYF